MQPTASTVLVFLARLLSVALALGAAGCDCGGPSRNGVCNVPVPPAACGMSCSPTARCPGGFYCGPMNTCTADCTMTRPCNSGYVCNAGMCVSTTDTGSDVPRRDGEGYDNTCASVALDTNRVTPNVLVIVDRSGSMESNEFPPGSGVTRWDALRDSLLAMPSGLIFALQSSVRFGLVTYENSDSPASCPDLDAVPAGLDNYTNIRTAYLGYEPGRDTPTGDSITAVLSMLGTLIKDTAPGDPTIFILATDGEPDTCEDGDDTVGGRLESLAAVEAAFRMGVETYAISVGTDVGRDHLQDVANAGLGRSGSDPDAMFWVASDTAGLNAALEAIVGGVVDCRLTLSGTIDPALACMGEVRLGDRLLPCDDPDGWRAIDATTIELTGSACDDLQSRGETLTARFPCDVVVF